MTIRRCVWAALLLFAAGCGGPPPAPPPAWLTQAKFDAVQNGMSLAQVEQSLGNWSNLERNVAVKVEGGQKQADQYQWKREGKEIDINVIGDKVVSKSAKGLSP